MDCYVAGVPFFRGTLIGDIVFSVLLFGSYAIIKMKYFSVNK